MSTQAISARDTLMKETLRKANLDTEPHETPVPKQETEVFGKI